MGDRGCLSLFATNAKTHRMLGEHLTSEYFIKTEARGRSSQTTTGSTGSSAPLLRHRFKEQFYLEPSQFAKLPRNA